MVDLHIPPKQDAHKERQNKQCPVCKNNRESGQSFSFISAGALFLEDPENGRPHDQMEGYLDFGVHGSHLSFPATNDAILHIGKHQERGQLELEFCSTKCLRTFLNSCVDELESQLQES